MGIIKVMSPEKAKGFRTAASKLKMDLGQLQGAGSAVTEGKGGAMGRAHSGYSMVLEGMRE